MKVVIQVGRLANSQKETWKARVLELNATGYGDTKAAAIKGAMKQAQTALAFHLEVGNVVLDNTDTSIIVKELKTESEDGIITGVCDAQKTSTTVTDSSKTSVAKLRVQSKGIGAFENHRRRGRPKVLQDKSDRTDR